jgi:hypothetical protein
MEDMEILCITGKGNVRNNLERFHIYNETIKSLINAL